MTRQGRCVLPTDESGRVLDRLAGLEKIITTTVIRQVLAKTKPGLQRACKLPHEVMLWVVLAMGIQTDVPIRQVFKLSRRLRMGEATPHRSSLCVARQRLGIRPVRCLFLEVARPLARPDTPGAFYRGLRLMGIDGTVLNVPDSPENAERFGRPAGGDRGEGAFPQVRKLSLVELGTHAEVAIQIKPCTWSEQAMLPPLLRRLTPEMLLIWDRNFFSYELWKTLNSAEIKVLARVKSNLILEPIERLSDGSYLAKIYPRDYARQKDRDGIVVRVIKYTLDDPQRVGHGEEHTLLTNLMDDRTYPAAEMISGYHERWEHELVFDEQKTHQDPRRATKPAHLRSETPAGVIQEVYAVSLGHFVVRALMFEAAQQEQLDPDCLSFTGCFHILQCRLPECHGRNRQSFQEWCEGLLWELTQERTEPRRNRINPRVIKQKMSKWPKKRPEHRHPPPLTKTFAQSVVMLC
jgi:hypothetical protein